MREHGNIMLKNLLLSEWMVRCFILNTSLTCGKICEFCAYIFRDFSSFPPLAWSRCLSLRSSLLLSHFCHNFPVCHLVSSISTVAWAVQLSSLPPQTQIPVSRLGKLVIIALLTQLPRVSPGDPGQVAGAGQAGEARPGLGGRAQLQSLGGVQLGAAQHCVQSAAYHTGAVIPADLGAM